jgi:hypothetical protein
MIKKFQGIVENIGDEYRVQCREDKKEGSIWIGGQDVVLELADVKFNGKVTVAIADDRFAGELSIETGWGYSEPWATQTERFIYTYEAMTFEKVDYNQARPRE